MEGARARAERLQNPRLLAEVYHRLGEWHAKRSDVKAALAPLERARHFAALVQWSRKEIEILQTLALAAYQVGDWPTAKARLEAALALQLVWRPFLPREGKKSKCPVDPRWTLRSTNHLRSRPKKKAARLEIDN